jgi:hypothetical protein
LNANSRLTFDILMIIMVIFSPLRLWIAGVWLFKNIIEVILGIVGMKRLGEKNLFPGICLFKSFSPVINSIFFLNQQVIGNRRKWK